MNIKPPKKLPRNGAARAARLRNSSGPMKHRNEPRKGAKNDQPELLHRIAHCGDKTMMCYTDQFCGCICEVCEGYDN